MNIFTTVTPPFRKDPLSWQLVLWGLIGLKFFIQYLVIHPDFDLHRDEYLHLDQANHLAWGYQSVPPFTSWVSWLIRELGNTEFWVKFFPALFGAGTLWVVWEIIRVTGGGLYARVLGVVCVLFSALIRINLLYQPNSFDVLGWVTAYYLLLRYIDSQHPKWIYGFALTIALSFLNKYNILFLVMGLIPATLLTDARRLWSDKHLYFAILMALLLISPNLWWQYANDFPVLRHMKELSERQLVNVDRKDFVIGQVLFFLGAVPVIVAGLAALLVYQPFRNYQIFFWSFFITLFIFLYLRAKNYYAIGLYPFYIAMGATALETYSSRGWRKYLRPLLIALPLMYFGLVYDPLFPHKTPQQMVEQPDRYRKFGLLRWEDGQDHHMPQDFADMLGWKEMAQRVDSLYRLSPQPRQTLVICDNYGQAGAVNYYTREAVRAVSFNADYIHWFDLSQPYIHVIRVINSREKIQEIEALSPFFERTVIDSLRHPYARESGAAIVGFYNAKVDVNAVLEKEIQAVLETHR